MGLIQSGASSDLLTIGATSKAARASLYDDAGTVIHRADGGAIGSADSHLPIGGQGEGVYEVLRMDRLGGLATANYNHLFHEPFEAATVSSPNRLTATTTTFTQAQTASAGLNFNSGAVTTSASAAFVQTNKRFVKMGRGTLHCRFRARAAHVSNAVIEMGLGAPASQTVSPTVGAYFQITSGAAVQGVMSFNSIDTTVSLSMPSGWQSNYYLWDVVVYDDRIVFSVMETAGTSVVTTGTIKLPIAQARLFDATRLPAYARLHFSSAPATAATLYVSMLDVFSMDEMMGKPWDHVQACSGMGGECVPTTFAQAANYTNSTAPTSATLSNTAAGYTTLGGQFQFAAVAGAETDFALFGYTVPAPYTFVCTGISISAFNIGAAIATTGTVISWFLSPDQTAISLATATNRRTTLGSQAWLVGAAIGAPADKEIVRTFTAQVTNSGRILVIGFKNPVGTATASQIIRGTVSVHGYYE